MVIRWGLIGCGDIAEKRVADAIIRDSNSQLLVACRRDEEKLVRFAERYGVEHWTTSAEELIAREDVDAVYIATPVEMHAPQTASAAAAGKHVLVEKPMAMDSTQCQLMVDLCQQAGVQLGVAYYRRFYPVVARVKELIRSGVLGRPLSILATTGNPNRFPKDDWRVVRSQGGGGPLMDIGSHRLDLFLDLFGEVVDVKAMCARSPDYEAEDMATLLVEFKAGQHGVLQCYFGTVDTPDRLEVIGTDGRVTIEDLNEGSLLAVTSEGETRECHPPHENFHAPLIADFTAAVLRQTEPAVPGHVGLATNDIIEAAYASFPVASPDA
ncbi:Gfo/Idh/MocA family protein [Roseiconus lacunae]|uniref:Gfo/Idh/MocA family oxidoreductase n=1 Tax=Roseiconus lacunae TaxID=2605694 RepID=A0ABT7PIA5_9BACT|nr:Gfo/Idh/MocA family oxidoreductase [Roseiconus lacunae]MCD0458342.1 Gfo/Idh/MocA family oxidoreductase [Roseiconus lacunae]MDM4016232.1 Gfo/Idh/MocA family oxidoreductase [Roseiconus lacunae]